MRRSKNLTCDEYTCFLPLVDISLGLNRLIALSIFIKVSTSVASTRLILGSDWLIAIYNNNNNNVLVLVLVVDERGSFSAIDAHIFPCLIQTVLEDVD